MKEKVWMVVFVLVLGSLLTFALVRVDAYTAPFIAKNQAKKLQISILKTLDIPFTEEDVNEVFTKKVQTESIGEEDSYYIAEESGDIVFRFLGSGLWGPIEGTLALAPDLETIRGISIIHQEETPGLGGRIAEDDFLNRFKTKKISPTLTLLSPGKAVRENEVDGISGATLSCKAFVAIINSQTQKYVSLIKESK